MFFLICSALVVALHIWLVYRTVPTRRLLWFVIGSMISIAVLGFYISPIAIIITVIVCFFLRKDENNIGSELLQNIIPTVGMGVGLIFIPFIIGLPIGEVYWLWLSVVEYKSFQMFLIGIFPLTAIISAPVGLYSLIFGAPDWLISWFG